MKSLFLKIFVSFGLAHALFLVLAILVTYAGRPARDSSASPEFLRSTVLPEAIEVFKTRGPKDAAEYLDNVATPRHLRIFLFDADGNEVTGRPVPPWAAQMFRTGAPHIHNWMDRFMPPRSIKIADQASGGGMGLLVQYPGENRVLGGPHGPPGLGLAIAVLSSGLVSFLLAYYLTKPIVRLRSATHRLSAGDLTARAGTGSNRGGDEIAELVRDFDTMAGRLESLVNAQSRLLKDISHELRSPLARLSVALGLIRQRTGPEVQTSLDRIELESTRLNDLIGRLLTLSRLEGSADAPARVTVKLGDLVCEVARDAEFEAQSRGCEVRCEVAEDSTVQGDPALLRSAVENVVRNAIRYTGDGSVVRVTVARGAGDQAVIRVLDSGPGVPASELENIFRPFHRLDDARNRETGGVGLGLSITDRAIRLHGGTVTASNLTDGGLAVEIRLPQASGFALPVHS